jgi:hypothetical protein
VRETQAAATDLQEPALPTETAQAPGAAVVPRLRSPADALALQRLAGNRAVAQLARRHVMDSVLVEGKRGTLKPGDDGPDIQLLQLKLNYHLGYLRKPLVDVDSAYGLPTTNALNLVLKALGVAQPKGGVVDEPVWQALDADPRKTAVAAAKVKQDSLPEYERMINDGLLEVAIAIGFDEHGITPGELLEVRRGLVEVRGYKRDAKRAEAMRAAVGRKVTDAAGEWYVKEDVGMSAGTTVHAVVRVIAPVHESSVGDSGAASAKAALAGMNESDLFLYGGHARYGTGPDFDRNYHFVIDWDAKGAPKVAGHYGKEKVGSDEITTLLPISTPAGFEKLEKAGVVQFVADPSGNLTLNEAALSHKGDLGAYFISRASKGRANPLTAGIVERKYRLWMFNGCTTNDYVKTIRTDPYLQTKDLDVTVTDPATALTSYGEGILSYFDGVVARESAAALDERMEQATPFDVNSHHNEGFADNPAAP